MRLLQQALLQVLIPVFDPGVLGIPALGSDLNAADMMRCERCQHVREGYTWVVDMDLEVRLPGQPHDILMSRVARKVKDPRIPRLHGRYLNPGAMINRVAVASEEGTPQGGLISPLLANILLDNLDKELEKCGHHFCRSADDCNIYVRTTGG